ncbi:MAG: HlyC/CorC family transporter [Candidatus Omnitrophica bacterium]|nr:HlyC/CorC family transporter [Candidatus Omnitrophota bacterium]
MLLAHGLILVVLLLFAGFFAAAETAIFSLTKIEKNRLGEKHQRMIGWIQDHLSNPRRTLNTIIIGNLFVHVLATAIVTLVAMEVWGGKGTGPALFIFTVILIVVGEIIPKILAVRFNELVAFIVSFPLRVFAVIFFPFRWLVRSISNRIVKLLIPIRKELSSDQISEDELKTLVKIGEEEGVLDRQERYMIQKLMDLGERQVKDIMTPRIDLAALDLDDPREKHEDIIRRHHFSYFPVYQESIDNIVGVTSVQEFMLNPAQDLKSMVIEPLYVPEAKRIDDLLAEFRRKTHNFAVCVDEYGGTAGIVTLEDILEEIFGEFYDEYAVVERPIRPFGHQEYFVEAKVPLADFNEYFNSDLVADEASTLGGYILELLGEVPKKGKVFDTREFEFRIHDVIRQRRIRSVIVKKRNK